MAAHAANIDLMGATPAGQDTSLGLAGLRLGDLVLMADQDHRFGRGFRAGWLSVGVMVTGECALFGHGPGASTLLTGPAEAFDVVIDPAANLARCLQELP